MARRHRVRVLLNGEPVEVEVSRPRTKGTPLMPTREIESDRDKARRRRRGKHPQRSREEW